MSRHWWLQPLRPRRPRWTFKRHDYRRYIGAGGPNWITRMALRVHAWFTGSCIECGLRQGLHKVSCDAGWRARRAKRLRGGLDG